VRRCYAVATATMRILHLSTRLILGGSQENTVLSCEGQANAGHAVALAFGPIFGPEGSLLERVRSHGGIETIEVPDLVREIAPRRDWRCLRRLEALIADWRPDVIHTHSSKAGILGRIAAWRAKVPAVVHTIHGLPFHPYQPKLVHAAYVMAERFAAKRCHAIVTVADAMRDQALAAGVGRREQYLTIHSGMEIEPFLSPKTTREETRAALGIAETALVVGTVSRLAELKGHDDLLDALAEPMRRRRTLRLLWVGDGWWRERLEARLHQLGIADQVTLTGLVPPERVAELLPAMDILVHPSYREGLPRAVVQGLLASLPVIAFDCDGAREVCIHGETGRLVPPGDLTALRNEVELLADRADLRQAMGARGRELCRGPFAAETMVRRLLALYERLLYGEPVRSAASDDDFTIATTNRAASDSTAPARSSDDPPERPDFDSASGPEPQPDSAPGSESGEELAKDPGGDRTVDRTREAE